MIFKLALRNVLRQKRRSILTILTMVGGLMLNAVSIGWTDGSYNSIIDSFTRNLTGHLQIHARGFLDRPSLYKTIDGYRAVGAGIDSVPGVESWAPRVYAAGLASVGDRSTACEIIGIDPARDDRTTNFGAKVKRGLTLSPVASRQAVLGKGLAELLKADIDSQVVIVSQAADGSIANDGYRVVGIASSGDEAGDRMAFYLHIADAQILLALEGRVHELVVNTAGLARVAPATSALRRRFTAQGLDVQPWQVVARAFYQSMEADKRGNNVMFIIVMLIVAVGVLNTVLMSVLERTREFGVLKALGTRPWWIFKLVMAEVMTMAAISVVIGTAVGLAANYVLSIYGIRITPMDVGGMLFDTMRSEISVKTVVLPAGLVLLASLLVAIFPARRASLIEPARAMRIH